MNHVTHTVFMFANTLRWLISENRDYKIMCCDYWATEHRFDETVLWQTITGVSLVAILHFSSHIKKIYKRIHQELWRAKPKGSICSLYK